MYRRIYDTRVKNCFVICFARLEECFSQCSTTTSTAALLKGVVDVGQCYEKSGGYLQWAVGISPSTLMSAAELSKNINEGVKSNAKFNNSSPVSNSGTNSNGLIPTEGFSYIDDSF